VFSLSIESEWTDENDNILYGSYDASLTQQLTEDCDLRTDLIGLLTEVALSLSHVFCSCEKHKVVDIKDSTTYLSFTATFF